MRNFLFCIVFVASLHSLAPFKTAKFNGVFIFENLAAQDFQNLNAQITATQTHETSPNYSILQKSHEIIKLPQAYIQNPSIRGENINAGIIDSSFNPNHPSLQDKLKGEMNNFEFTQRIGNNESVRFVVRHGSHVAGIMLGADLEVPNTPSGIAPKANFYGFAFDNLMLPYNPDFYKSYDFFKEANQKDGIKIINNSWGLDFYPTIDREIQKRNRYRQLSGNHLESVGVANANDIPQWLQDFGKDSASNPISTQREYLVYELLQLSKDFGILNIVASGNEGISAPSILGALPSFDESLRSIIVVGAIDARDAIINGDSIEIKNCSTSSCATEISNTFIGAQNYAITAPGGMIDSANAFYKESTGFTEAQNNSIKQDFNGAGLNEFLPMTGTSMATPMVSGAAILVQQKYPFLSGAQIADVLLSTANKNIITPKLYVKSGQDLDSQLDPRVYYNVIYVKNDQNPDPIPQKDGEIDLAQVKKDLENLGYTGNNGKTSADYILTNLLSEVTKNDSGFPANNGAYEGIIALTKEQIFGQGILDVAKALKGIAILDANRLNSENVQNFNGKNYAFYTINTQGQSGEFSNNISQKKWDDDLHLSNALNSPKDAIRGLDVGLLKTGAGTLILSGNNTYNAPTRVNNGTLKIQGEDSNFGSGANGADNLDSVKTSAKGVLVNSQGFSESSGVLQLEYAYLPKGAVAQNGGVVLISQSSRLDSEILARNNGEIRIPESSTLYLGNSQNRQSATLSDGGILKNDGALYGNIANLNGGNLSSTGTIYGDISNNSGTFRSEGVMYGNVTNLNGGILSGAGTIYGDVANISGVVKAGFSEPTLTLDSERTLTIQGKYSQGANGILMLAFDGRDSAKFQNLNTKISAQSYDIQGGELVYAPIFLGLDSQIIKAGQKFTLNLGDLTSQIENFGSIEVKGTNTLKFKLNDDKASFEAVRKVGAFTPQNTGNTSIGIVLTQIADLQNLNEKYSTFLGNLDVNAKPKEFQETLESIENNAYLDAIQQSFNDIFAQGIENLNFISTPMNSFHTSPKTAFNEFGTNGVRSDFASSLGVGKNSSQFVINANALKLKHKQYDTSGYGGGFALKNALDKNKILAVFFDYSNTNSVHKFGNVKSDSVRAGAGLNVKLSHFDWFALGSVGYGKNASSRRIYGEFENLNGSFDNYQLSLQTGIARDFEFDNFDFGSVVLKPMVSASHTMIYQAAFSESAGILSKSYDANNFGISSLLAGGNAQVHFSLKRGASVGVGAFAFYTQRLNTALQGSAVFSDFKNLSFSQNAQVSDSGAYFGASAQGSYGRYFGNVGLYVEQSRFYTLSSVSVNFGVAF